MSKQRKHHQLLFEIGQNFAVPEDLTDQDAAHPVDKNAPALKKLTRKVASFPDLNHFQFNHTDTLLVSPSVRNLSGVIIHCDIRFSIVCYYSYAYKSNKIIGLYKENN